MAMDIASVEHGILPVAVLYSDWIGLGVEIQFPDSDKPEVCLPMLKDIRSSNCEKLGYFWT